MKNSSEVNAEIDYCYCRLICNDINNLKKIIDDGEVKVTNDPSLIGGSPETAADRESQVSQRTQAVSGWTLKKVKIDLVDLERTHSYTRSIGNVCWKRRKG